MTDKTTTTARIEGAKALIRAQFDDLWGGQNLSPERVAEFYSPTYKGHDPILGETNGPDEVYETITAVREAFPDTTVDILDQWGTLDRVGVTVTTRYVVRSTHKGEFSGIPATNNPVELFRVNVDRIVGEQIAWSWSCTDSLSLYRQIGSLPTELASQMNPPANYLPSHEGVRSQKRAEAIRVCLVNSVGFCGLLGVARPKWSDRGLCLS